VGIRPSDETGSDAWKVDKSTIFKSPKMTGPQKNEPREVKDIVGVPHIRLVVTYPAEANKFKPSIIGSKRASPAATIDMVIDASKIFSQRSRQIFGYAAAELW
jgi:hypothetical protein